MIFFTKVIVNTRQEFEKYIVCNDDVYPAIDFSKHSLLLVGFGFGSGKYALFKNAENHYTLRAAQGINYETSGKIIVAIFIPKITDDCFIGIYYYLYFLNNQINI